MTGSPSHRAEQTGNPGLDRIQNNVRDLVQFAKQLLARVVGVELRHGSAGVKTVFIANADRDLTAAEFTGTHWLLTGTLTANRTLIVPRATDAGAYARTVFNSTTGGFTVAFRNDDGTSTSLTNNTGGHLVVYGSFGPEFWI